MLTLEKVAERLLENDNIYILTHQFPDGDALGSGFALCKALNYLGKKAKVLVVGEYPKKFEYLKSGIDECNFESDYIVSVDVADEKLLGENKDIYSGRIDLAIDHHESHRLFAKESYVDGKSGANAEIIYKIIKLLKVPFDKDISNAIYTGICTDTGCFKYPNATSETFRIVADVIDSGAESAKISREMFDTKSFARVRMECAVLDNIELFANNKASVICVTLDLLKETGAKDEEIEGLSSLPRQIEGVLVGVMIREKKLGGYKISVRTTGEYNASEICAIFGGGGHRGAGGCTIDGTLEEVKEKLKNEITKFIGE